MGGDLLVTQVQVVERRDVADRGGLAVEVRNVIGQPDEGAGTESDQPESSTPLARDHVHVTRRSLFSLVIVAYRSDEVQQEALYADRLLVVVVEHSPEPTEAASEPLDWGRRGRRPRTLLEASLVLHELVHESHVTESLQRFPGIQRDAPRGPGWQLARRGSTLGRCSVSSVRLILRSEGMCGWVLQADAAREIAALIAAVLC